MGERTDKEILDQTNNLSRLFYLRMGYKVSLDFKFYESKFPQEKLCWEMACESQLELTDTNLEDVLIELEIWD